METARGRWFLAEYARRNRHADTTMLLKALDRIDALVPPGTNVNAADAGYQPPSLSRKARRRSRR